MDTLEGRTVVVTGGAHGIGKGIARAFLAQGSNVVLADVRLDAAAHTAGELDPSGQRVAAVACDVREPDQLEAARAATEARFGPADVVCANAGVFVGTSGKPWELTVDEWRWMHEINVFGVIHTMRAFVPGMVERGRGHFVTTASMQGITTGSGGPYASSKHAAAALTETLFLGLKDGGTGVSASCLCPSFVRNAVADAPDEATRLPGLPDDPAAKASMAEIFARGMDPDLVGQMVTEAVLSDTFWIIPSPESLERVTKRCAAILERRPPEAW